MLGRKFIMAMLIIVACFVYRAFGWINEGTLQTIVIFVAGLYIGGNVAHSAVEAKK